MPCRNEELSHVAAEDMSSDATEDTSLQFATIETSSVAAEDICSVAVAMEHMSPKRQAFSCSRNPVFYCNRRHFFKEAAKSGFAKT